MALKTFPPLVAVPTADIRSSLDSLQWETCIDAWLSLGELYLRLPPTQLSRPADLGDLVSPFVTSFYHERRRVSPSDQTLTSAKARQLQQIAFQLIARLATELNSCPNEILDWQFLTDFCSVHVKNQNLPRILESIWNADPSRLETSVIKAKTTITKGLETKPPAETIQNLTELAPIFQTSPRIAALFFTGSDFSDALLSVYHRTSDDSIRKSIVAIEYLGLIALTDSNVSNFSLLSDHLYELKALADKTRTTPTIFADLITNTPLVTKLQLSIDGKTLERLKKLLSVSSEYRLSSIARPRSLKRKPARSKGKDRATNDEFHVHQMSLVSQIQDLFPDLGSGFILKLLDEYHDNIEQVTASLLDDSLPPHLAGLDRSEQAGISQQNDQEKIDHLAPRHTPPPQPIVHDFIPERRNVFDNDELDLMEHDMSRLHLGKKEIQPTTDNQPNKAAILSALAAFDSDDDERDDTYDMDDVGGTIDTAHPDGEPTTATTTTSSSSQPSDLDTALFAVYKTSPELFSRTFDVRKSQARAALKIETQMTDEALEGWAIMLQRDPRRQRRLEENSQAFDGKQASLARTSYRDSETEDSDAPGGAGAGRGRGGAGRSRGSRGGRGRGRGSGRGGNVAGASGDPATANAQRRKEANKSSRANHNRRDQRARKMARGGFAG